MFTVLSRIRESRCFNGGTETWQTVTDTYRRHERVVILTDEQAFGGHGAADPGTAAIPLIYTWNLAGYAPAHSRSGELGRYTFGGLTDKMFGVIPMLESARDGAWPWEET